jgi:hypothetical protein
MAARSHQHHEQGRHPDMARRGPLVRRLILAERSIVVRVPSLRVLCPALAKHAYPNGLGATCGSRWWPGLLHVLLKIACLCGPCTGARAWPPVTPGGVNGAVCPVPCGGPYTAAGIADGRRSPDEPTLTGRTARLAPPYKASIPRAPYGAPIPQPRPHATAGVVGEPRARTGPQGWRPGLHRRARPPPAPGSVPLRCRSQGSYRYTVRTDPYPTGPDQDHKNRTP